MKEPNKNKWLHDRINPYLIQLHSLKKVIYSGQTKFQSIDIVDTDSFGICLVLDGKIQSSEKDEFIYHEALVHPVLITHPNPKKVFIAGGGEGATLREVLAHKSVEIVVMVDIDQEVVNICRQFLPSFHQNSFTDSRAQLYFTDARKYLENTKEEFDAIILDLTDPIKRGLASALYTKEFYRLIRRRLKPGGIMCTQAGACSWQSFPVVSANIKSIFSIACNYLTFVPSFVDLWGFVCGSEKLNPAQLSPQEIDQRITTRVSKKLRFYDGLTHQAMFIFPKHLRQI